MTESWIRGVRGDRVYRRATLRPGTTAAKRLLSVYKAHAAQESTQAIAFW